MSSSLSQSDDTLDDPPTGPPGHARRGLLPLIRRLHFYAGVLVAPFILIAAITGALYAVAPTIERVVYRDVLFVEPGGEVLPLSAQAAAAQAAVPDLTMTGLRPAAGTTDSSRVLFADTALGEEFSRAVFVDPYSGAVLGQEPTWFGYLPLSTWLDGLHRHLQLGEPGRVYSELAASWLWVVALGGLVLWWGRRRAERRRGRPGRLLTVDRTTEARGRTLNWHGAVGIWILPMLLFLSATGITWSTYAGEWVTDLRTQFDWARPQLDTAGSGAHQGHDGAMAPAEAGPMDVDGIVRAANAGGVVAPLELTLPAAPGEAASVTELDEPYRLTTNSAAVDPATLQVRGVVDYGRDYSLIAKLADWGIRMHMGFLFGWLNQLVLFVVASALVTVIMRGYRMWWQRRPTRGSQWAVGRAPMRGLLSRQHPAVLAAVAVCAVVVGVFLPLLGISLLAFLLLDVILGRVKASQPG
ncbi:MULTISPECIES: PepSY-associated TM helix domain-containing protein [unclassified Mycobacterium]|uniref:PepSY-associated TM helix domain-containing protein n=1 Tax=unclassified Mycobacterium TaxID=2642494 RepID=UPI0029C63852|nr:MULTISPECIES: PepSY-associated TM helix domain-containing protein [unclassified Mycobacterium]